MSKAALAIQAVLALAVIILFWLQLSGPGTATEEETTEQVEDSLEKPGDARVVYFNVDSLWANYQFVVDMENELKTEEAGMKARYESTVKKFEKEVTEFQKQAQFMTQQDAQEKQMELQLNEQSIMNLEQSLNKKYLEEKEAKTKVVHDAIRKYLEAYREENGYDYIFGQSFGNIPSASPALDVTTEVVAGLNAEYEASQNTAENTEEK